MADIEKEQAVKILKKILMPAAYDTIFTKYRLVFLVIGVILLFMGFKSAIYFWLGVIILVSFVLMVFASMAARKSMMQRMSKI